MRQRRGRLGSVDYSTLGRAWTCEKEKFPETVGTTKRLHRKAQKDFWFEVLGRGGESGLTESARVPNQKIKTCRRGPDGILRVMFEKGCWWLSQAVPTKRKRRCRGGGGWGK